MKNKAKSIIKIINNTLRNNRMIIFSMSGLFLLILGFFLWNISVIQKENIEIKELVYSLEKNNLDEQNSVFALCLARSEITKEKYSSIRASWNTCYKCNYRGCKVRRNR